MQARLPVAAGASSTGRKAAGSAEGLSRPASNRRRLTVRPLVSLSVPKTPRVWEASLERIPTLFGKLVFVAELFDEQTGKYGHRGLAFLMDDEAVDRFIRRNHLTLFRRWLRMGASSQIDDFSSYIVRAGDQREQVLVSCTRLEPHSLMVPQGASDDELLTYLKSIDYGLDYLYAFYGLTSDVQPSVLEHHSIKDSGEIKSSGERVFRVLRRGYAWLAKAPASLAY